MMTLRIRVILKIVLARPSFIMAVGGCSAVQKTQIKGVWGGGVVKASCSESPRIP